jgi:hypothetical protein
MNKLRESFYKEVKFMERAEKCEQITDDFTCQFVVWLDKNKKELKNEIIIEELLNYFKDNVYNK